MEMTANFWNPGAGGGGDLRATVLARAPQVATFVLALAIAAQLAFIVVAMTSRSRQAAPRLCLLRVDRAFRPANFVSHLPRTED